SLAVDPSRVVRDAAEAARVERTERSWMSHHLRAVIWAAERGGPLEVLAAWRHALAVRLGVDDPQARTLLRWGGGAPLAPNMRAWIEHLATWRSDRGTWARAIERIERLEQGSLFNTSGDMIAVEGVRWSRGLLPPALILFEPARDAVPAPFD